MDDVLLVQEALEALISGDHTEGAYMFRQIADSLEEGSLTLPVDQLNLMFHTLLFQLND